MGLKCTLVDVFAPVFPARTYGCKYETDFFCICTNTAHFHVFVHKYGTFPMYLCTNTAQSHVFAHKYGTFPCICAQIRHIPVYLCTNTVRSHVFVHKYGTFLCISKAIWHISDVLADSGSRLCAHMHMHTMPHRPISSTDSTLLCSYSARSCCPHVLNHTPFAQRSTAQ